MKFSIEIDSVNGAIKIKSEKDFEKSADVQPTTLIKSTVDENVHQDAGPSAGLPQIKDHAVGEISTSIMTQSSDMTGGSAQQPAFQSDTFDFLKGHTARENGSRQR